jgi:hypothetical protein
MAAFEDFDFFRRGSTTALLPRPPRGERDALRAELERIHVEVSRLHGHVRRRSWTRRLLGLPWRFWRRAARDVAFSP